MAAKNLPTPKSEAGGDQDKGPHGVRSKDQIDHETATELQTGPAGSQITDKGDVQLPPGSTRDTLREGHEHFPGRKVHRPGSPDLPGDEDEDDEKSPKSISRRFGPQRDEQSGEEQKFTKAVDMIAAAVKKFTEAGMSGTTAGELALKAFGVVCCGHRPQ